MNLLRKTSTIRPLTLFALLFRERTRRREWFGSRRRRESRNRYCPRIGFSACLADGEKIASARFGSSNDYLLVNEGFRSQIAHICSGEGIISVQTVACAQAHRSPMKSQSQRFFVPNSGKD
jgi:hypothetical protein